MFEGISVWQLLIVLAIAIVIFGTKRLSNVGGDVGKAIKSFKKAVKDDDNATVEKRDAEFTADDRDTGGKTHPDSSD